MPDVTSSIVDNAAAVPNSPSSIAAWEAAADEVERIDPEKIDRYPSVKGSSARMRTDDRTLLIVHL